MSKHLLIVGLITMLLWSFVTAMSLGLPESFCQFFDNLTFHLFSQEISHMANGFYYDVNNNDMPTVIFLVIFSIIFFLYFYILCVAQKKEGNHRSLWIVILFAILFRVILIPSESIHENDIYRYLWDGRSVTHGINPYKYAPADLFMYEEGITYDYYDSFNEVVIKAHAFTKEDKRNLETLIKLRDKNVTFYERIGHWQVPTIYPPVAQGVFALSNFVKENSVFLLKFIFVFLIT